MTHDPASPGEQQHGQGPGGPGWQGGPPPGYEGGPPPGYGQPPPPGWGPGGPGGPPGPGAPPGFGAGPSGGPQSEARGFLSALFDFGFNYFATPAVVKVLYIIGMVILALGYVFVVIGGFSQGIGLGLAALIGGALVGLFYLTLFRVTLEFYYAVVRMSEDIHHRR